MARSFSFVADLPTLNDEQLEKLYAWGKSSCENFDVHLKGDASMTLVAKRKKDGDVRAHQRLLRTNLVHWGVELSAKQTGWLRLLPNDGISYETASPARAHDAVDQMNNSNTAPPAAAHERSALRLPVNMLSTCGGDAHPAQEQSRLCRAV